MRDVPVQFKTLGFLLFSLRLWFFKNLFEFSPSGFKLKSLLPLFLIGWNHMYCSDGFSRGFLFLLDCLFVFRWSHTHTMPDVDARFLRMPMYHRSVWSVYADVETERKRQDLFLEFDISGI